MKGSFSDVASGLGLKLSANFPFIVTIFLFFLGFEHPLALIPSFETQGMVASPCIARRELVLPVYRG